MKRQLNMFASATTGTARCRVASPNTTVGTSGSSCACTRRAWPTAKKAQVNWCPGCTTRPGQRAGRRRLLLAPRGNARRSSATLEQWFFRTTAYAEELLDGLDRLADGWPERVLTMQRNWIGKSTGTEVDFTLEGTATKIRVFTTRVDTIFRRDLSDSRAAAPAGCGIRFRRARQKDGRGRRRPRALATLRRKASSADVTPSIPTAAKEFRSGSAISS